MSRTSTNPMPTAVVRPERRWTWAWLVPIAALLFAGYMGYEIWSQRGVTIEITLEHGHGIEPGAALRYRGIVIGEVHDVSLTTDGQHVRARVQIDKDQVTRIARAGSRFWVVRPQLGLGELSGLDTIVGQRYLAVHPGSGSLQKRFTALADPPVVEQIDAGDLQILIRAAARSGLRRGAMVTYREIPVGAVLSVGLTSDAGAVEARVVIFKQYTELIRQGTRFWATSDISIEAGITGVSLTLHSLESLLTGGIALATPPDAGEVVLTGHRFELAEEPADEWLEWQPQVSIGSRLLPSGTTLPSPQTARLIWQQGRLLRSDKSRSGLLLPTELGVIAPADLLTAPEEARAQSVELHVVGREFLMPAEPEVATEALGRSQVVLGEYVWPLSRMRPAGEPEDCVLVKDAGERPMPIAASRFTEVEGAAYWAVDASLSLDRSWHGAAVVARDDGRIIGLLVVDEDADEPLRVGLLTDALLQPVSDDS